MDERSQALLHGLVAGCVQLLLRHGHGAASHASGGVDFDEIGACLFLFSHEGADFIGAAGLGAAAHQRLGRG
jgi:hypothetical protein